MSAYYEESNLSKNRRESSLSRKELEELNKVYSPPSDGPGPSFWKENGIYYMGLEGPIGVDMDTAECDYSTDVYRFESFEELLNQFKK